MVSAAFATLTLMSRLPASTPSLCLSATVEPAPDLLQTWLHQVMESTDFNDLVDKELWLSSTRLVVQPDMVFGKRGKSGLVALNLDLAGIAAFVKERLGKEVEMGGCKGPITTFIDPLESNLGNSMLGFSSLLMGEKKCFDFEASSLSREIF